MAALKRSLRRIPYWAYLFIFFVIVVKTTWIFLTYQTPVDGILADLRNGQWIVSQIDPGGPAEKAGLRLGDIVISVDSMDLKEFIVTRYPPEKDETAVYRIERDGKEMILPYTFGGLGAGILAFFMGVYILFTICSIAGLYILLKKSGDFSAGLFFVYIQLFVITSNAGYLGSESPFALFVNVSFTMAFTLLGAVLVHFHLIFPKQSVFYKKVRQLPAIFYGIGTVLSLYVSVLFFISVYNPFPQSETMISKSIDYSLRFSALTFFFALIVVIFQYVTMESTLQRNQLRILIIGSFFAFLTTMTMAFFPGLFMYFNFPYNVEVSQTAGSIIMILCILIAIFRYRIWDIEVVIRKALLYLGATTVIILTYLFLIWLVDQFMAGATDIIRFTALATSVILFLALRDRIQRLIDRVFHRETYDSATVVSDFEAKLAGIYRFEELKQKIAEGLDQIFHFKSFVFSLKKGGLYYEPAFIIGNVNPMSGTDYAISRDMEEKLQKSKVFSPEELNQKPPLLEAIKGDLIVPMVSGGQPEGFFICGQKKSERIYSRQDLNVLTLLARRVVALLYTASLYQKDLDRQLMLERERARISQDMHDDIGAGLTKIAMISEAPVKLITSFDFRITNGDLAQPTDVCQISTTSSISRTIPEELQDRLRKIATSSREMISRLNVIVWALNPKYDNLESLISYLRRYFGEYLESFGIQFTSDFPEEIPDISITPDTRRNIFYAVQEAIHNAVKHSGCSEIGLTIQPHPLNPSPLYNLTPQPPLLKERRSKRERSFTITIADNGKGFEQVNPGSGGNGLQNMKKRAEEIGGSFKIQSSSGNGTRVIFNIDL